MTAHIAAYDACKRVVHALLEPLRVDTSNEQFTLAIPEAQTTTTGDSEQGWHNRPPALLRCPGCDGQMAQSDPIDDIECSECWRTFDEQHFGDHELLALVCPRCNTAMTHGTRHPGVFDVPEYATCEDCQYHWDLDHWY